ncbi:hypothetical protein BAY61_07240 [Prauserella marina]|uniref:DUF8017 domain-containing protein n=1 Tax=Prauserella marina TaxID=530584 RepID=A0A222VM52_9PSEU|nr:hypothetical protein [Prauserella marina]ASR34801.1 hypothetical protein BAY61_07240 [Prauserella marina]PWV85508.1 hypothetical protein DES30_1011536 [Prauserella marina]SDC53182.1 hypothetical protein SAMN05421630_102455 [Prauserella marina]
MSWFRGKKDPGNGYGYEDRAALKGVGGYEPADPADATPRSVTSAPRSTGTSSPDAGGLPPAPPPRPGLQPSLSGARRGRKSGTAGAITAGVVAVVAVFGGVVMSVGAKDSSEKAQSESERSSEAPYSPPPVIEVPAAVPGWQPVVGRDGSYAYDVPPEWTPEPGVTHGWESGPGISLSTSAFLDPGYCGGDDPSRRAGSGLTIVEDTSVRAAAEETVRVVAMSGFRTDAGELPAVAPDPSVPVELSFDGQAVEAMVAVATVWVAEHAEPCLASSVLVGAVAVPTQGGDSIVLVAYADEDKSDADELTRVLTSLRTVAEEDRTTVPGPTA